MNTGYSTFVSSDGPLSNAQLVTNSESDHSDPLLEKASKGYTVDQAIDKLGFGRFQITLSLISSCAWMADAMEIMVLSILGPVLLCQWRLSSVQEALITTVVFVGFVVGSPVIGYLADKFGRRTSLIMSAVHSSFYGILSALSPIYSWLLVLRALTGFGLAGTPQVVTYYTEFLPSKHRGKCIMGLEVSFALGGFVEVVLAIVVLQNFGWRWWLVASAVPLLVFVAMAWTLPESPRYLITSGQREAALKVLQRVADSNGKTLPLGELRMEAQVPSTRLFDLLSPEHRRITIVVWIMWFLCMFSYYGIVILATELVQRDKPCVEDNMSGIRSVSTCSVECAKLATDDFIALLWTSVSEIPGIFLTLLYVDYLDRRLAMAVNMVMFSLFVLLLFICLNKMFVVAMLFCARALAVSALQLLYIYTSEVYPTTLRGTGLGSANVFGRSGVIIAPFVAQVLLSANLRAALAVFGGAGILASVVVAFLPTDTRHSQLKDL